MKPQTITIRACLHQAQAVIHQSPARFRVVAAGRRFGKTRLGVNECLDAAIKGGRAWWIAPTYKITEVGWRPLMRIASKIPGAKVSLSDRMIGLPGGGEVWVRSGDNPQGLRGEGLHYVVLDECAYMQEDVWREAIRPALSDTSGRALFISTPNGLNWFWSLYQRGVSGETGWASFQYPTSANPYISPDEIEAARKDLPELTFMQEYEAQFVSMEGAVFRRVQEAAVSEPLDAPLPGHQYIAGVDVASSVDYTVVSVFDVAEKRQVHLDRFSRVDYNVLEDRLHAIYQRWNMDAMTIEGNSIGQGVIDHLVQRGMRVQRFITTSATKQAAIQLLQSGLEHAILKIINNPIQIGELLSYESKRNASGSFSYSAPAGMHDDTVMALAIAWWSLERGRAVALSANPFYD